MQKIPYILSIKGRGSRSRDFKKFRTLTNKRKKGLKQ